MKVTRAGAEEWIMKMIPTVATVTGSAEEVKRIMVIHKDQDMETTATWIVTGIELEIATAVAMVMRMTETADNGQRIVAIGMRDHAEAVKRPTTAANLATRIITRKANGEMNEVAVLTVVTMQENTVRVTVNMVHPQCIPDLQAKMMKGSANY